MQSFGRTNIHTNTAPTFRHIPLVLLNAGILNEEMSLEVLFFGLGGPEVTSSSAVEAPDPLYIGPVVVDERIRWTNTLPLI